MPNMNALRLNMLGRKCTRVPFLERIVDLGFRTVPIAEKLLGCAIRDRLSILLMHFHSSALKAGGIDVLSRLKFLKKRRTVLPLPDALNTLQKRGHLPYGAVSLVIDDATGNFHEAGWPFLKSLELPFTLAVIPGLIPGDGREHLIAKLMRMAGHEFFLPRADMLRRGFSFLDRCNIATAGCDKSFTGFFAAISNLHESTLIALIEHLRIPDDIFMDWDQLNELKESGLVNFASHSMSHPVMTFAEGPWLEWEAGRSADLIRERLGVEVDTFAYPYGHKDCISHKVAETVKSLGYRYVLTTIPGTVSKNSDFLCLPRLDAESRYTFPLKASPVLASLLYK